MAPLNEDQLEQIRIERKNQIMAAALKVFAENGLKLTKISMIAKEAGISHGLLYHYFQSKEEVLYNSLEWAMTGTEELFDQVNNLNASPKERIKHFLKIAFTEGNSDVFRVIQHTIRANSPIPEPVKILIDTSSAEYIKQLFPLFAQAQEHGEFILGDTQELLELFLTIVSGIMMEGDLEWWKNNMDRKIDLLLRMFTTKE
ncbi:TetR/AcrR family transcriptional regulator [Sutcliffiella sp. NPDC057660]|uniref:TetR/AcrR family transcriptional regulator n=1 Tax=Sutcliffiella sp. NPDC057660 TaxID=3346199 RepID=UPI0036A7B0B1